MSAPSGGGKKSLARRVGTFLILLCVLITGGATYAYFNLPPYWLELQQVKMQVGWGNHIKNDTQMKKEIAGGRKNDNNKKEFSMDDIERDREAIRPGYERSAKIDLVVKEAEAGFQGKFLVHESVWLPASQSSWLYTDIPVKSCMMITVRGEIEYGTYRAGPAGIDLDSMDPRNRQSFLDLKSNGTTLVPGVRWGTVMGCIQPDGEKSGNYCSRPFPIGEGVYIAPEQVGDGYLWAIVNGYVTRDTDARILNSINRLNMSDYNAYGKGFRIDRRKVPEYFCNQTQQ